MAVTSITMDQDAAMALRRVRQQMSEQAGRMVPMSAVVKRVVDAWLQSDDGIPPAPCPECSSLLAYSHNDGCSLA